MSQISKIFEDNSNNGLITKIWGPPLWDSLHSITFGYPKLPTEEQKDSYKQFFTLIGDVLPCRYCRDSYKQFITTGNTELTYDTMKNRDTFTRWFYLVHEAVNKKLGVNYGISYNDVVVKYESYRASCKKDKLKKDNKGCIMPLDDKAQSYKIASNKNCAIIPIDIAKQFIPYAKLRGLSENDYIFIEEYDKNAQFKKKRSDINCELWCKRNKESFDIITGMRISALMSIEQDGKWEGLPTIEETKLIMRMASNLSNDELINLINKLPNNHNIIKDKIYVLKTIN
jgi:hypothetical protein